MRDSTSRICLGVDTSLRSTGWGVVEARGSSLRACGYGVIRTGPNRLHTECFLALRKGLMEAVQAHHPSEAAIEGVFFAKNLKTSLSLGQARGVVLVTMAEFGVPVYEYAPRRVKQAVVGFGAADKLQVAAMVCRLLNLEERPPEDAADALAVAICRLHAGGSPLSDPAKPI